MTAALKRFLILTVLAGIALLVLCSPSHSRPPAVDPWYYQDQADPLFFIPDKAQHYFGSAGLAAIAARHTSRPVAAAGAILAGTLWELKDDLAGIGFSWKDLTADVLGAAAGAIGWRGRFVSWLTYSETDKTITVHILLKL